MSTTALSRARRRGGVIAPGTPALLVLAFIAACSEGTGPAGQARRLEAISAPDLVGTVGEALSSPIQVRVLNSRGSRVAGAEVEFVASPGGFVAAEPGQSGHMRSTITSNHEGIASVIWTLGEGAGEQVLTAGIGNLAPIEYRATAAPGPAAAIVAVAGDNQLGVTGTGLANPIMVRVRDKFGNGIPGVSVDWELGAGDGSLSSQRSQTDESGVASVALTMGATVGPSSVTAKHDDLEPAEFVQLGLTVVVEDAVDDTFSYGTAREFVLPDILALGAGWYSDTLLIGVTFKDVVTPAYVLDDHFMGGNLDFDTDLNPETGEISSVDVQRRGGGETGMGVDLYVDMFARSNGNFVVFAFDPELSFVGQITPVFRENLVYFSLPYSMVNADSMAMALVVATYREATDIAPEDEATLVRRD